FCIHLDLSKTRLHLRRHADPAGLLSAMAAGYRKSHAVCQRPLRTRALVRHANRRIIRQRHGITTGLDRGPDALADTGLSTRAYTIDGEWRLTIRAERRRIAPQS